MRNLLVTAMMLVVVVLLFISIVSGNGGVQDAIEQKGSNAVTKITSVTIE